MPKLDPRQIDIWNYLLLDKNFHYHQFSEYNPKYLYNNLSLQIFLIYVFYLAYLISEQL